MNTDTKKHHGRTRGARVAGGPPSRGAPKARSEGHDIDLCGSFPRYGLGDRPRGPLPSGICLGGPPQRRSKPARLGALRAGAPACDLTSAARLEGGTPRPGPGGTAGSLNGSPNGSANEGANGSGGRWNGGGAGRRRKAWRRSRTFPVPRLPPPCWQRSPRPWRTRTSVGLARKFQTCTRRHTLYIVNHTLLTIYSVRK